MANDRIRGRFLLTLVLAGLSLLIPDSIRAQSQTTATSGMIQKVTAPSQRITLTANSSRILTFQQNMKQGQINNESLVELKLLTPTELQVFAKKAGVTSINLWDEEGNLYTIDVVIYGDARELEMILKDEFPNASIRIKPISQGALVSGFVHEPDDIRNIIEIAEQFYPKVLKNIRVGGAHQVVLHLKVMEVSRTKLDALGFDWRQISGNNIVASTVSGLMSVSADALSTGTSGAETFKFSVVDGANSFLGVLEALQNDNLMKILAEPTLVTISGRPAFFRVGGEFPILVPQSQGVVSIEFKQFGTQVDFVPRVLGNGRIRLEVRPSVSEVDSTRSVVVNSYTIPGIRVREVDTAVNMMAGQTLAIAGLVQNRIEAKRHGIPLVSDIPYVGGLFRRVEYQNNEIELLILVTPDLVEAMDPHEVPACGPGMRTGNPTVRELFLKGHIEVPNCSPADYQTMGGYGSNGNIRPEMRANYPVENVAPLPANMYDSANQIPTKAPPYNGSFNRALDQGATADHRQFPPNQYRQPTSNIPESQKQMPGLVGPVGFDVVH